MTGMGLKPSPAILKGLGFFSLRDVFFPFVCIRLSSRHYREYKALVTATFPPEAYYLTSILLTGKATAIMSSVSQSRPSGNGGGRGRCCGRLIGHDHHHPFMGSG